MEKTSDPNNPAIAEIRFQDNTCTVSQTIEPLWRVIKNMQNSENSTGYILQQGDILKFGRVRYIVKELVRNSVAESKSVMDVEIGEEGNTCKICLCDSTDPGNPLVSHCNCSGTMKYIHVECLQMCVNSQLSVRKNDYCNTYSWRSMHCSICSAPFPISIRAQGKVYEILNFERPEAPYLVIETVGQYTNQGGIHTMCLKNIEKITLGRGHDSNIRIADISVSRVHAKIRYAQGEFILEDQNSKFGTLVMIKDAEITSDRKLVLQSGRTLLSFKLKNAN